MTRATASRVVLKPEAIAQMHRLAGTASKVELAKTIGVDPGELAVAATGRTSPSMALLARIIVAFPQFTFATVCRVA